MLLHPFLLVASDGLIHKVDPFLNAEVFHHSPRILSAPHALPSERDESIYPRWIRGERVGKKKRTCCSGKAFGVSEFPEKDEGATEIRAGVYAPELPHSVLKRGGDTAAAQVFAV